MEGIKRIDRAPSKRRGNKRQIEADKNIKGIEKNVMIVLNISVEYS